MCGKFFDMENKVTGLKNIINNIKNKNVPKYKKKIFVVIFLARVLSILTKLLHTVRKKIKNESWKLVKKQKSYSK